MSGVNMSMTEVTCQKAVNSTNFSQGVQRFIWSTGRPSVWSPYRSYMRVRCRVTGAGGAALGGDTCPKLSECIALSENCVANAYSNAYFLGGGATISQITNFFGQASMVEARSTNSLGWSNSMGLGSYAWNGDFTSRCASISRSAMRTSGTKIATISTVLPGFSQSEGKEVISKPIDLSTAANANNASVAISTGGVLTLANGANFGTGGSPLVSGTAYLGSTLVVDGIRYQLGAAADGTYLVTPAPAVAVVATTNWYLVTRATTAARQAQNYIDVCFRPTGLGIWNYDGWLGAGDWQLALVPDSNYINNMLQTINGNTASVEIIDAQLYVCTMQMSIPDQVSTLHLREYAVQTKPATGLSSNLSFSVPPSSETLYVFLQSNTTGSTSVYPPSRFTVANDLQNNIQSCQVTYANRSSPMTRWNSGFVAPKSTTGAIPTADYTSNTGTATTDAQDLLAQLYTQSQMELGKANDATGTETYNQWLQRGVLLAYNFVRDSSDRSTEVQLNLTFNSDPTGLGVNVFLCAEYRKVVEITQSNGMITSVRSLNT